MSTATEDGPEKYRVLRAFREDGVMYTSDAQGEVAALSPSVRKSRLERGYIAELHPATPATEAAAKAKE